MKFFQLNFLFLLLVGIMVTISNNIVLAQQVESIITSGGTECRYFMNDLVFFIKD